MSTRDTINAIAMACVVAAFCTLWGCRQTTTNVYLSGSYSTSVVDVRAEQGKQVDIPTTATVPAGAIGGLVP